MLITMQWLHDNAAAHTPYGSSFTAAQVKVLGLKYPLQKGWMERLVGAEITDEDAKQFIAAKTHKIQ
jgi:hypothetical protein